jgi:hypothetical protein
MREALEAAYDEDSSEEQETEETGGSEENTSESVGDTSQEIGGDETTLSDEANELEPEAKAEVEPTEETVEDPEAPVGDTKAPASWKPGAREDWAKVPAAAQAEINRREKEIAGAMQTASVDRKAAGEFREAFQPYQQLITAQNSNPIETIKNLMQTTAGLTMGNVNQKAQIVADIIANYGVDINMLDGLLAGQVPEGPAPAAPSPFEHEMRQFMGEVRGSQQRYAQNSQQELDNSIETFAGNPAHEFFNDVREDMADILDLAANRGRELTMEDAYKQATQLNPEIAAVLSQRSTQANLMDGKGKLEAKRRASASVGGGNAGGTDTTAGNTLRGALEDAWAGD